MPEPKVNEVWETKGGNLVLIVSVPCKIPQPVGTSQIAAALAFVWWDSIEGDFAVTEVMNQLDFKVDLDFERWASKVKTWRERRESPVDDPQHNK